MSAPTPARPTSPDDRAAWIQAVLDRLEGPLLAYATRLMAGDLERARDAVQESFLRLCKERRNDVDGHAAEWLYTVCRNLCLDVRRKESRMRELDGAATQVRVSSAEAATAAVDEADTRDAVMRQLTALPEKQQEVLRLKFQHGLSYREIGRVTGETVGNVGWLIHTGIRNLRGRMASQGVEA